jgi:iron complex transport system substrate-binding protein
MRRIDLLLILAIVFTGCVRNSPEKQKHSPAYAPDSSLVKFAGGFSLVKKQDLTIITVKDPWQHASGIQYNYLLSDTLSNSVIVDEFTCQIKTPVQKVVCLSTTHIGFLEFMNEIPSITGVSGKNFVVNRALRARIDQGSTVDVGYDESLNYELLLHIKPDVVFAYGIGMGITNTVRKLNELGIPVVLIGEYLEEDPLAKMEWIKVFAAFYKKGPEVAGRFDSVACSYRKLMELAAKAEGKPEVLLGLPWRGTWYISGSQSYAAKMIVDAGGKYIMDHLDYNESRPMNLEEVYRQALMADYWLNPGDAKSRADILAVDERFADLPSFKQNRVFNNNNNLNESGGNAFYETGVVEPDIILSDLIYILHPQLLPSHTCKYYKMLR